MHGHAITSVTPFTALLTVLAPRRAADLDFVF